MKRPLLLGSLLCNVALGTVFFLRVSRETAPSEALVPQVASGAGERGASPTKEATIDPGMWTALPSDAPADFIARLRAEGFPPAVVRALARQLVREHFRDRHAALAEAESGKPYWRGDGRFSADAKLNAERRALGRDEQAMLQQLLGAEAWQPAPDQLAALQQRFGNLPAEKLTQLQKIVADYNDLTKQVTDAANGITLPQDRATLALLQKERDADVVRLLTPDETLEYELHHSSTANRLLNQLSAFDPTEQEFRALFALNRSVDAEYGNPGVLSQEQRRARADALKQLSSQIEATLGPSRYAEYQRAIDPGYQQALQLVTRLELPKENAAQVFAVQKEVEQRMAALRADRSLGNEQRQAQLGALHEEATRKLTSSLGERGLEAYRENGGFWLQNLQRSSAPRPAAKAEARPAP